MAKKLKTVFVCQECGYESPKWLGQCICGAWGSMVEEKVHDSVEDIRGRISVTAQKDGKHARASRLKNVGSAERERLDTGVGELNRVLGKGLVKGSLTCLCLDTAFKP